MHYLMQNPENSLPVIVNGDSRQYAELSMAGYLPIAQGYRKQLESIEEDMLSDMYSSDLDLNQSN